MRTFTGLVLLIAVLESSRAEADIDLISKCDTCAVVAFSVLGGALFVGTHAFFFDQLRSNGPSLTQASIIMLAEHAVLAGVAAVFLADSLMHRSDPAFVAAYAGWLAVSVGMMGTAGLALYKSRTQPVKAITVAPAGLGASVSIRW